jgi:hypothetical protein
MFCILTPKATTAQERQLTVDEAKTLSQQLLNGGQVAAASQIIAVIVQQFPNDPEALIIQASAARELGQTEQSIKAAREAYSLTSETELRYVAARLVSVGLAEQGRFSFAQLWLRFARQHAPNATEEQSVARDYQVLRRVNPWSYTLSFGLAPSGNINGGSQGNSGYLDDNVDETFAAFLEAFGIYDPQTGLRLLGDNERALSGYEATLGFGTQYRLNQTQKSATYLSANASVARYWLSDEAKELSPTSENQDFNRDSLSFGLNHRRIMADGMRPTTFTIGVGGNWYGGEKNNRFLSASISQPYLITEKDLVTLSGSANVSASFSNDIPVTNVGVNARWMHILPTNDRVGASMGLNRGISDIDDSNFNSINLGATYTFGKPIAGMRINLSTAATFTDFGETRHAPFDREELKLRANADISVPAAEVFGFLPVISFSAEQVRSNVDQFDSTSFGMGLDFKSAF